jgi:hypothetical protein
MSIPSLIAVSARGVYYDLPIPSVYECSPNEVVEAERNVLGDLVKDRITVKRSIEVEWNMLLSDQSTMVAGLTETNTFHIRYFDPETKKFVYGEFYRGSNYRHVPVHSADSRWDGKDFKRWRIEFSLVEV